MEVLWFRKNKEQWIKDDPETLKNEITEAQLVRDQQGFEDIYWPSVVGAYTVKWPHEAPNGYEPVSKGSAIVMASNDGSGPLNSLQAQGVGLFPERRNAARLQPERGTRDDAGRSAVCFA